LQRHQHPGPALRHDNPASIDHAAERVDRAALIDWYRRNRERSRALFDLLAGDEPLYRRPIPLRHPFIFYEGHVPAFSFATLVRHALGGAAIDERLETLFARGIDPPTDPSPGLPADPSSGSPAEPTSSAAADATSDRESWPDRRVVRAFAAEADARVLHALEEADLDRPGHPFLDRAEVVFVVLEHEAMHQETLLYMLHRLDFPSKRRPAGTFSATDAAARIGSPTDRPPRQEWIRIPAGRATLGVDRAAVRFAWDNECPSLVAPVPSFEMERHDVTNAAFMEFVEAGGYDEQRFWREDDWDWIRRERIRHPRFWETEGGSFFWRGLFERVPLPAACPVFVTHAEASAYARWRGVRLPTEAEFQRAAYGAPDGIERPFPWGAAAPDASRGLFGFDAFDPAPAGSHPTGRSAWGVDDLVGNGWEWTSTPFAPFPGFEARASYPQYSTDFFDGAHYVMKGASPATARELLRPTFRNWFRPRYPYVYATFRCARGGA
jgi:iron(II)-dependent oxidoreductase